MSAAANNFLTSASWADLVLDQAAIGKRICGRTSLTPGMSRTGGTNVEASILSSIKVWPTSNATSFKGDLFTEHSGKTNCAVSLRWVSQSAATKAKSVAGFRSQSFLTQRDHCICMQAAP